MIKSIGFGKKSAAMSHEESCRYHREVHAPMAKRLLGPRGLTRYVGYYVDKAYSFTGKALPELPWDRIVPEWFTEKLWAEMWDWRKTDPAGRELAADEKKFGQGGMMLLCDEKEILNSPESGVGVNVIFLASRRKNMSHEEFAAYHLEQYAPLVVHTFGDRLQRYVVSHPYEGLTLAEGSMPVLPYDTIVTARFGHDAWRDMKSWRLGPEGARLAEAEEAFLDRDKAIALVCQEYVHIA